MSLLNEHRIVGCANVKTKEIWLKEDETVKEKHIQGMIAKDPTMLGFNELTLIGWEVKYKSRGRLDLLFQSKDLITIYEVEIQLGQLDGSHLFRTVEYWLNERDDKRGHKHVAVLIVEGVTPRALEIINLCMKDVSIIILKMKASKNENGILELKFEQIPTECAIMDCDNNAIDHEYKKYPEIVVCDREYYENNAPEALLKASDKIYDFLKEIDSAVKRNYTTKYMRFKKDKIRGFVFIEIEQDKLILLKLVLKKLAETETKIREADLNLKEYYQRKDKKCGEYIIRITEDDIKNKEKDLKELLQMTYDYNVNI